MSNNNHNAPHNTQNNTQKSIEKLTSMLKRTKNQAHNKFENYANNTHTHNNAASTNNPNTTSNHPNTNTAFNKPYTNAPHANNPNQSNNNNPNNNLGNNLDNNSNNAPNNESLNSLLQSLQKIDFDRLKDKIFSTQTLYILGIISIAIGVLYYSLAPSSKPQNIKSNNLLNDFNITNIPNQIYTTDKKTEANAIQDLHNNDELLKLYNDDDKDSKQKNGQENAQYNGKNNGQNDKNSNNTNNSNNKPNFQQLNTQGANPNARLELPNNSNRSNDDDILDIPIPKRIINDNAERKVYPSMIVKNTRRNSSDRYNNDQNKDDNIRITSNVLKYEYKGNLEKIIAQGTIVKGYLTSAINTDFGGDMIQAVIADNVYAAGGYNKILIPKGSKILGRYNTNFSDIGRLIIQWYRIDLPGGQVITITNAPSVDDLLRPGANAKINNKHLSLLKSITVLSALNIGLAFGADKMDYWMSSNSTPGIETSLNTTLNELEILKREKSTSTYRIQESLNKNLPKNMRDKIDNTNIDNAISDVNKLINSQKATRTSDALTSTQTEFSNVLREIFRKINPKPCAMIKQGDQINIYIMEDLLLPDKPKKLPNKFKT